MSDPLRDDTQEIAAKMVVPYTQTEAEAEAKTKPPPAAEAGPRSRRLTSEAKWAANSVNATRSTGPTSTAGKARAALNAVTHGSTCNTLIFLKDELPEEYYAEVNRWAKLLGASNEAQYAHAEIAVYNIWKMRRARNAGAVAINKVTDGLHQAYYQRHHARLLELIAMIPHSPRAAYRELRETTQGVRWILLMLEQLARTLAVAGKFTATQRAELTYLFGLVPIDLCIDRQVVRLLFDLLALEYGRGTLTAADAAALLAEYRPGSTTVEEFQRHLEPHLAGMFTVEQAREYIRLAIAKMRQDLTNHLKLLQAYEEQEIARDIVQAKCDISAAGQRYNQNEDRAEAGHFRSLRGFYALKDAERKFAAGEPDDLDTQEHPPHAAASPVVDRPAAPEAGAVRAGEAPGENEPTVPQADGAAKSCNEEAVQPELPSSAAGPVRFTAMTALMAEDPRRVAHRPLRE
jgi:hypothetical protein